MVEPIMSHSENLPWLCEWTDLLSPEYVTHEAAQRIMRAWNHYAGLLDIKDQKDLWHYLVRLCVPKPLETPIESHLFCKSFFDPRTGKLDPSTVTLPSWILYTAITTSCYPTMKALVIDLYGEGMFTRFDMGHPSPAESATPMSQGSSGVTMSKSVEAELIEAIQRATGPENFEADKGDSETAHSISSPTNDLADELVQFIMRIHQHRESVEKLERACDSLLEAMGEKVRKDP